MGTLNKVILVGHLGKDPKAMTMKSGGAFARLSVATNERTKDASGQWTERPEWHNVVCFGKSAEFCEKYLVKGALVLVEGRLQTRKWQDREGQDRYTTEIVAARVQGLLKGQGQGQPQGQPAPQPEPQRGPGFPETPDAFDDIPF